MPASELAQPRQSLEMVWARPNAPPPVALRREPSSGPARPLDAVGRLQVVVVHHPPAPTGLGHEAGAVVAGAERHAAIVALCPTGRPCLGGAAGATADGGVGFLSMTDNEPHDDLLEERRRLAATEREAQQAYDLATQTQPLNSGQVQAVPVVKLKELQDRLTAAIAERKAFDEENPPRSVG